jgi:hypothetical protein
VESWPGFQDSLQDSVGGFFKKRLVVVQAHETE